VYQVQLILENFVLEFNPSGQPLQTVDLFFDFDRAIEKTMVTQGADPKK
jgi:hypothetical protein